MNYVVPTLQLCVLSLLLPTVIDNHIQEYEFITKERDQHNQYIFSSKQANDWNPQILRSFLDE